MGSQTNANVPHERESTRTRIDGNILSSCMEAASADPVEAIAAEPGHTTAPKHIKAASQSSIAARKESEESIAGSGQETNAKKQASKSDPKQSAGKASVPGTAGKSVLCEPVKAQFTTELALNKQGMEVPSVVTPDASARQESEESEETAITQKGLIGLTSQLHPMANDPIACRPIASDTSARNPSSDGLLAGSMPRLFMPLPIRKSQQQSQYTHKTPTSGTDPQMRSDPSLFHPERTDLQKAAAQKSRGQIALDALLAVSPPTFDSPEKQNVLPQTRTVQSSDPGSPKPPISTTSDSSSISVKEWLENLRKKELERFAMESKQLLGVFDAHTQRTRDQVCVCTHLERLFAD